MYTYVCKFNFIEKTETSNLLRHVIMACYMHLMTTEDSTMTSGQGSSDPVITADGRFLPSNFIFCPDIALWEHVPLTVMAEYDQDTKRMHWIARYGMVHISGTVPFENKQTMHSVIETFNPSTSDLASMLINIRKKVPDDYIVSSVFSGFIDLLDKTLKGVVLTPWAEDQLSDYAGYDTDFAESDADFYRRATYYIINDIVHHYEKQV